MSAQDELVRWVRETPGASEMLMEDVMLYDPDPLDVTPRMVLVCPICRADHFSFVAHSDFEVRHLTLARLGRSSSKVVLLALGVGAALGFVAGWVAR